MIIYNFSDLTPIEKANEQNTAGNFHISEPIEVYVPGYEATGFYKENRTIIYEIESPDYNLREFLCAQLLEKLGVPHADILLARNDNSREANKSGSNACISMNILNKNEKFVEMPPMPQNVNNPNQINLKKPKNPIDSFIEDDLEHTDIICRMHMPSQTSKDRRNINEFKKERKDFLLKRLFISALISDHDFRSDNMLMIQNQETGKLRNPQYYDMGLSFVKDEHKKFWGMTSSQVLDYLYEKYPSIIVPFGKQIAQNFTKANINGIMQNDIFKSGFSNDTWNYISNDLFHKTEVLERYQTISKNKFHYGVDKVHDAVKGVSFFFKDHAKRLIEKMKKDKDKKER